MSCHVTQEDCIFLTAMLLYTNAIFLTATIQR
jgi:hypothetical protein